MFSRHGYPDLFDLTGSVNIERRKKGSHGNAFNLLKQCNQ